MILTGKQPEEEQQPVESVKLETGTRLGTVKLTVDGKTTDNILIKGLAKKNLLGNLNDKYAAKDHKHKEYLKPSEVNITGTGLNGEVVFTEATPPDTTNGTLTLKMKEGQEFQRIIDLPFTGLKHLAFADKLTSYPDEMASSFYNDMCTDLNLDLEFVSTTRSSTINGGSLTIQKNSQNIGGNLTCLDISADDIDASTLDTTGNISSGGDISATGNISTVNGNISSTNGNVSAGGTITAGSNISGVNILASGNVSATGNISSEGNITVDGNITAGSNEPNTGNITGAHFIVPNGEGTQFLKADGSLDSTTYLTSEDISGIYKFKGSVTNYSDLPSTGNRNGDVWNVVNAYGDYPAGTNFAWATNDWDPLGGSIDLSGYVPTSREVNGKALSSNITLSASDVGALPDSTTIPTALSDLTDDSTHRLVTDAEKTTWSGKGTYSKPSGGIPKTDLESAVQTSLGKADTALQIETDPVFSASAAAGITSSDITNWNSKTSNIGTITSVKMNGTTISSSGEADLGTVITSHQDISGKADKATTLSGYGITDAYTKTEVDNIVDDYLPLSGGTLTGSLTATNITATGSISAGTTISAGTDILAGGSLYLKNNTGIYVENSGGTSRYLFGFNNYNNLAIGYDIRTSNNLYLYGKNLNFVTNSTAVRMIIDSNGNVGIGTTSPASKLDVSGDINSTGSISAGTTITAGGDITTSGSIYMANNTNLYSKDSNGTYCSLLNLGSYLTIGHGIRTTCSSYIYGKYIYFSTNGTAIRMLISSSGNVGIGNTNPQYILDVGGTVNATSYNTASDERLKAIREEIKLNIEDIAAAPSILFNWKDKQDDSIHGGTIAQYWKDIASWAVNEDSEGILGLDYSVLALSSAIQCAREIVDLKKRIEKLEERL